MIISVKDGISSYDVCVEQITQICGQNIPVKSFIINSLCKYFSADKYFEYEEKLIDNTFIDGENPGRKMWECMHVATIEDIVQFMQLGRKSVVNKVIKECLTTFDNQAGLMEIDNILISILDRINKEYLGSERLELQYESEDILSVVCNTSVKTREGKDIHELTAWELFNEFIDMLEKLQVKVPDKRLIVFENIDHFLTRDQYIGFVDKCENIAYGNNIWFIFSTSLKGYLYCSEEYIESINIVNDEMFSIGSVEKMVEYVGSSYPINKKLRKEEIMDLLPEIVQQIGNKDAIDEVENQVILKLINSSMGFRYKWRKEPKDAEIRYLMDDV
ncbi:CRISPR-associated protein Csn2-St [Butyrivibrio sp. AE2005]|uniref:CRISPR-associated protein Csn2-St n=1 Tax=Butyrivibrio sp. AE2005 TaxID=1496722 RepID=UPI00047B8D33|nr:CRISPR-associated protein Csn2-St [Butyrivibrio sp. AE2005]